MAARQKSGQKKEHVGGRMQFITSPGALGLMSVLMCLCTGNGTEVRGHWEAREDIMENKPQSECVRRAGEIKTEGARLLQMEGRRLQWNVPALQCCVISITEYWE